MNHDSAPFCIVADSSCDILSLPQVPFASVPMKIVTSEREFTDREDLDIPTMIDYLKQYKGKSGSSCPSIDDWLRAFGEHTHIFCVTITSGLSGSYNAAQAAKRLYLADHPDRRIFLIDSLSAGPGQRLLVEKLEELILSGLDFAQICQQITAYQKKTSLVFMLASLTNFANNGRVSPAVAKIAGLLNILIVGQASREGTLQPLHKCRGFKRALEALIRHLEEHGYCGGKIRISHCFNEEGAQSFRRALCERFPEADIRIDPTRGLCSFYAEKGGLLIGFEHPRLVSEI